MVKTKDSGISQQPSDAEALTMMGDATTALFLLRDYEKFGLAERVCYHFDLTEGLSTTDESSIPAEVEHQDVCGVISLLDFNPTNPWHRLPKRQRKILKNELRGFNMAAEKLRQQRSLACYQPKKLPLPVNPSTRIFFAYEMTRIAFCVDASPSLTSTFGVIGNSNGPCCALDRLPDMARTFFNSLIEPVSASSLGDPGLWCPVIAVTVIAVFPLGKKSETNLLVRDFRVHDVKSAELLADRIDEWMHSEVELGISERMCRRNKTNSWGVPMNSSSLRDILEVGDYALSVLSSQARPLIVVATDGRSISCDGIVDVFSEIDRVDSPVVILDLSMPETHAMEEKPGRMLSGKNELNFLTYDPGGPSAFPLHLSDDSEALYGICRATGGCFLDSDLLTEASKSVAGQNPATETPNHYSFKRRFVKMNGVQWLILFSLSPLSPTFHSMWAKLAPPQYLRKRLHMGMVDAPVAADGQNNAITFNRHDNSVKQGSDNRRLGINESSPGIHKRPHNHSRVTFSIYVVSPIRIKALLLMRIKEGYRARQYGLSTQDADKVSIQFTLPLELGTVLHYELSYKALSSQHHMVGSAHIKIELSGDLGFIQSVKKDFLRQGSDGRLFTMAQKVSARLCQVLRSIRKEDCLQSYLCPPSSWSDQLSTPDTPFVRRLASLTTLQRRRHFQFDEFDVVCSGRMPYNMDDEFLSEFISVDNGEQELADNLSEWATQTAKAKSLYVKSMSTCDGTTSYCLIELIQSPVAPRLFSINLQFYGGTLPSDRFDLLSALKHSIFDLKDVDVLNKQMGPYLFEVSNCSFWKKRNVEIQNHYASWDLVNDPELLLLLMKRRSEMGKFLLLHSSDDRALFGKLVPEALVTKHATNDLGDSPGDLVQYQIAILSDKVNITLHMESECGIFFPFRSMGGEASRFNGMVRILRRRDQECGRALRSRTNLLRVFQADQGDTVGSEEESHYSSVQRMLAYSSRVSRKLRFFNSAPGGANDILEQMTESLLLSKSFGVRAAKLKIKPEESISDENAGLWFIIQFDRHTMSIVHLSLVDKIEENEDSGSQTYRHLTFFTSGVSDLYSKRDDMVDDDSTDSHISEYMCVTDFADRFEIAQRENFAAAAYLALRNDTSPMIESFDRGSLTKVLKTCDFVEIITVLVAGVGLSTDEDSLQVEHSKLYRSIKTIFRPVPGDDYCMFYCGDRHLGDTLGIDDDGSDSITTTDSSIDYSLENPSGEADLEEAGTDETRATFDDGLDKDPAYQHREEDLDTNWLFREILPPPVFVRFKLDGSSASIKDLHNISKSANLTAEISVFKTDGRSSEAPVSNFGYDRLPWTHQPVAVELSALLKSYVAEQTIERLRHQSSSISDEDLRLVRRCMKRVHNVVSFSIEVYFYVSKADAMVPASAPAGGEREVEEGFLLLNSEVKKNVFFEFRSVTRGGFVISGTEEANKPLDFWCFLYVQSNDGIVSSQIYHRDGEEKASEVLSKVHRVICSCVHRVNQQLLLKRLHRSRIASSLLVAEQEMKEDDPSITSNTKLESFFPGVFRCPIVFRTVFDLYHRCAANPSQVIRKLEATVLHNFAVSNRPGIFVYKDEVGAIFYMSLQAKGSGLDDDGQVELLVHGIHEPDSSVTRQLRQLLQRRLLLIAVDMLSSVLTKNPHFHWKPADVDFLRSFEKDWPSFGEEKPESLLQESFYEFPDEVNDPCMVLVMFRQNLCGSTFFHRLNDVGHVGKSPPITKSHSLDSGGTMLKWNEHDFTLYYNNAPSKLDPTFQGISTLTHKGAALSRQTGTGIAMLEISLIKSNGEAVGDLRFGEPAVPRDSVENFPIKSLRFRKLSTIPCGSKDDSICVRVRITDTALNRESLHEWIALTLDQALVAWTTERLIECQSLGRLRSYNLPLTSKWNTGDDTRAKLEAIDQLSPGLPALSSIFESSYDLPHPAISKIENHGVIRASSVSTKTLELLENCILSPLFSDLKQSSLIGHARPNMCVIRLSRSAKCQAVHLSWDSQHRKAIVKVASSNTIADICLEDSPIDCPEYICFFCLKEYDGKIDSIESHLRMYREVMVVEARTERSSSIELLEAIKRQNLKAFFRSFAFIFSVKRNRRFLWTYNWNPQLVKSVTARLQESDLSYLQEAGSSAYSLQLRSLRLLSPSAQFERKQKKVSTKRVIQKAPPKEKSPRLSADNPDEQYKPRSGPAPARRIRRPVAIRRPKLIGKSVEGAALQAVAASRKRASTNQFKSVTSSTPVKRLPSQNLREHAGGTKVSGGKGDPLPKALSRHPSTSRSQDEKNEERDEVLAGVHNDFRLLCSVKYGQLRRVSCLQRDAMIMLASIWWPKEDKQTIPTKVGNLIISKTPMAWSDACAFPPLPRGLEDLLVPTFARWIATFTPGLEILPCTTIGRASSAQASSSVLLSSVTRNVRGCKVLAVVKISKSQRNKGRHGGSIVRCQGWVLNLPRRPRAEQRLKAYANTNSLVSIEKDSAGMDKLTSDMHNSLILESLLFDFSASMVERAVKLLDSKIDHDDLIPTVRALMSKYPLDRQKRMPMLNYRAFEATIVLQSYRDKLIDMFDSKALIQRLYLEADKREMIRCGAGLCFTRGLSVKGSHSVCFITLHPTEVTKMQLVILCRTQGRNLSDFMFREGSNVAIHILDNIAVEAAAIAYRELKFVSEKLFRDSLWKSFASSNDVQANMAEERMLEMLRLTKTRPLMQMLGNTSTGVLPIVSTLLGSDSGIDWSTCCMSMKKDTLFSPHWSLGGDSFIMNLFYVEPEDIFLLLKVSEAGALVHVELVEKDEFVTMERRQTTIQRFLNFLLHFIWSSL